MSWEIQSCHIGHALSPWKDTKKEGREPQTCLIASLPPYTHMALALKAKELHNCSSPMVHLCSRLWTCNAGFDYYYSGNPLMRTLWGKLSKNRVLWMTRSFLNPQLFIYQTKVVNSKLNVPACLTLSPQDEKDQNNGKRCPNMPCKVGSELTWFMTHPISRDFIKISLHWGHTGVPWRAGDRAF